MIRPSERRQETFEEATDFLELATCGDKTVELGMKLKCFIFHL